MRSPVCCSICDFVACQECAAEQARIRVRVRVRVCVRACVQFFGRLWERRLLRALGRWKRSTCAQGHAAIAWTRDACGPVDGLRPSHRLDRTVITWTARIPGSVASAEPGMRAVAHQPLAAARSTAARPPARP
jgi:hypothetical protein